MKTLFNLLIILLSFTGYTQDWLEDTLTLKGNVKEVHYTRTVFVSDNEEDWWTLDNHYHYNANGFLVKSHISGNIDGKFENGVFRIFNDLGDKCVVEYKIVEGDTISKRVFSYNSINRIKKSNYYLDDEVWSSMYYTYNDAGLLSEKLAVTVRNDSLWDKYKYDTQQRMVKYIDSSKSLYKVKSWTYDSENRLVELKSEKLKAPKPIVVKMGHNGEVLEESKVDVLPRDSNHSIVVYEYNLLNQISKEVHAFIDSDEGEEVHYSYNDNGDVSIIVTIDTKTGDENKTTILYEYDNIGNWVTKSFFWNGEFDEIETREIDYY